MSTITYKMLRAIESKIQLGVSRHQIKKLNNGKSPYIHSRGTAELYIRLVRQYGNWLCQNGKNHCSLSEAKALAGVYISTLSDKSLWTQYTVRSALAKVFGCSGEELCRLPPRHYYDIKRGRTLTDRAKKVELRHPLLMAACRAVGLRAGKELAVVTAKNFHNGNPKRGQYPTRLYCRVKGKGGRWRDAIVLDGQGRDYILNCIKENPTGPLFQVPSGANIHRCRADYAAKCYVFAEQHGYCNGNMYRLRDGSGREYDKGALSFVATQLGHGGERYSTVVHNYLLYGDANRGS